MTDLLTPSEVAAFLRVRDRRTVRRRLAELGVPVVPFGRSYRVRAADLDRALRVAADVRRPDGHARATGVTLPPGARLWDAAPEMREQIGRAHV